mmetsp:Transcript_26844/g.48684  ORF Transcript_26844/g.48684 Transcript_26844/m.48684 type:complete len:214 (-) Transcript_26844:603-1244(-)
MRMNDDWHTSHNIKPLEKGENKFSHRTDIVHIKRSILLPIINLIHLLKRSIHLLILLLQQRQNNRPCHILHIHKIPRHLPISQNSNILVTQSHFQKQTDHTAVRILGILSWSVHVEEPQCHRGGWRYGIVGCIFVFISDELAHERLHSILGIGIRRKSSVGRRFLQWEQRGVGISVDCCGGGGHHLFYGFGRIHVGILGKVRGDVTIVIVYPP